MNLSYRNGIFHSYLKNSDIVLNKNDFDNA